MISKRQSFPSSLQFKSGRNTSSSSNNQIADEVRLDTTDVKRKLFGKNEHFTIVQEAALKIQKFVRGSLSRGRTSDMIQELIDGILSYREIVAKYAAEDEQRVKKQQNLNNLKIDNQVDWEDDELNNPGVNGPFIGAPKRISVDNKPWFHSDNAYTPSGTPVEVTLKERLNILECADSSSLARSWMKHHESTRQSSLETTDESVEGDCCFEKQDEPCPGPKSECTELRFKEQLDLGESQGSPQKSLNFAQDQHLDVSNLPSTETTQEGNNDDNSMSTRKDQQEVPFEYDNEIKGNSTNEAVSFPEEYLEESVAVEPGGRGYNRYRSSAAGRNKSRPWRDDTNVFDAY
jgi:hypothetical protein